MRKIKISQETASIIFKLLVDALFILSGFLLVTMVAETLIPGVSLSHSAFTKIFILIAIDLSAIYLLSPKIGTANNFDHKKTGFSKLILLLLFFLILLMLASLWKLSIVLNLAISLLAVLSGIMIYKSIAEEE